MPTFTFIKSHDYRDTSSDPVVEMTFSTDDVEVLRENFEDFINGAGFVTKPEEAEPEFERRLTETDYVAKEEDWAWNDAVSSKFSGSDNLHYFNLGGK